MSGKYVVYIQPGEDGTGTTICIPGLPYDKVWPECGDCIGELEALIQALSGEAPEVVLPSFDVIVSKLTAEVRAQINDPSGRIVINMGDRDIADVLDGITKNLSEILDVTEAEERDSHE